MSEFMFIIPEGWTQISQDVIDSVGATHIDDLINSGMLGELQQQLFQYTGIEYINDAKFFNTEVLVVKLAG